MTVPAEQQHSPQVQKKALGISPSANLLNKRGWPEAAEGTRCRGSEPCPAEEQRAPHTQLFLSTEMVKWCFCRGPYLLESCDLLGTVEETQGRFREGLIPRRLVSSFINT